MNTKEAISTKWKAVEGFNKGELFKKKKNKTLLSNYVSSEIIVKEKLARIWNDSALRLLDKSLNS